MPTTNAESGTNVEEIADGIYRINTPLSEQVVPGGFSFNQYLILDEEPLLFHTGPRKLFPAGARSGRGRDPGGASPLRRTVPRGGRRVRLDQ